MVHNKGYDTISNWSRNNHTNMFMCNASLHQPSKITEIATGWESSVPVLTKIMNVQDFVESNLQNKIKE